MPCHARREKRRAVPQLSYSSTVRIAVLSLSLLVLLLSCVALPQLARASPTVSTITSTSSLCPRCPLCARRQTSLRDRLKYCHSTSSYALSLFSSGGSELATATAAGASYREQRHRYPLELPFATDDAVRAQCVRDATDLLASRVRGQPQVVKPLLEVLRRKLAFPREPVVVHLAGDNGVGKTHTARLVSQALSLRCAADRDVCDAGDNLLVIAGTGFDGMPVSEARGRIVRQVTAHMEHYPHGVVLIDDLTAMEPALVAALAPLFGRASHFAEQLTDPQADSTHSSNVNNDNHLRGSSSQKGLLSWAWRPFSSPLKPPPPLSQLLVFITTDFGRQGRTVGKSRADIEAMVQHDFASLYGTLLPAYTRTFVFFPFTTQVAEEVVRSVVTDLPCALGEHLIAESWISDDAVAFLVEQHRAAWAGKENGHALRRLVEDELVSQLIVHWELHAVRERLLVRFELDEAELCVVLRLPNQHATAVFDVDAVMPAPEDDAASDEGTAGDL
ncbi:hypothetical protein ABB37_06957 [Leptomonas pyrrhocoris]|uniref:AAA+ ATPase domain-containing protein n=1 Tax=Leptomonas pyrrhocoris TaxID=157538 RepID=A0A0M9FWU4_LEPPY|nr:hypothetical protein ABB37_06957 [Leptomonas pyrrhocoris]KPA77589.1 hypothetical protein ABB37_06957 [Leptomonas pyrrhocoris]|eukprot:XP_015656028.1 hypothetical protein ABB37_06957 [Leptomonas pyrrhocoris]